MPKAGELSEPEQNSVAAHFGSFDLKYWIVTYSHFKHCPAEVWGFYLIINLCSFVTDLEV